MTPGAKLALLMGQKFNPYLLPSIAARYSLDGAASDSTYLLNSGNVALVADRSGNSAVNGLVLNGVAGNYASTPDAVALRVAGDIDLIACAAFPNWLLGTSQIILGKDNSTLAHRNYVFYINATDGKIGFNYSPVGAPTTVVQSTSTVAPAVSNFNALWVRVIRVAATGVITFYFSSDGITWTQLGNTVASAAGNIATTAGEPLAVGAFITGANLYANGTIYRAQIWNGIAATNVTPSGTGTKVFDANFTAQAKKLTNGSTFTESSSNAATVTLVSIGDLGARICGARDLVQLTALKQPAFSTGADGRNLATFNGSGMYMKNAPFSYTQPESVYFVGSLLNGTNQRNFYDGNSATERMALINIAGGATLELYAGSGPSPAGVSGLSLNKRAVIASVFNGASSSIGVNNNTPTTGNSGTQNGNGLLLASYYALDSSMNQTFSEIILRSAADATVLQLRIISFLVKKWNVPLP